MTLKQVVLSVLISTAVSGIALGIYERFVRQPRTPRLAVVDVGTLFAQVQQSTSVAAIRSPDGKTSQAATSDFGPRLQAALEATAHQCACTLVAMPAVFGASAGVPDLTPAVRERLTLASASPIAAPTAPRSSN